LGFIRVILLASQPGVNEGIVVDVERLYTALIVHINIEGCRFMGSEIKN
jgi:hypothetical protein